MYWRRHAGKHHDEPQRRMDDVLGRDDTPAQRTIMTAAMMPKQTFCATFDSSRPQAITELHLLPGAGFESRGLRERSPSTRPSFSLSCKQVGDRGSEYSYSGLQNSASKGHTSTQMPQYMHSA